MVFKNFKKIMKCSLLDKLLKYCITTKDVNFLESKCLQLHYNC